jgi:D-amino-acid dehydrogenase
MASLPSATEIVVIGAGAIGVSVAYALARDGHEVVVLDRGAVGMGASAGTASMVTASHAERMASPATLLEGLRFLPDPAGPLSLRPRPQLVPWLARFASASLRPRDAHAGSELLRRLALESLELHRSWAHELETGLVSAGTLNVYLSERGIAGRDEAAAEHRAAGLEVELLDAEALRERQPAILGALGAAFYPGDAHVDSLQYTQRVAEGARRLGARVLEGVEALRVDRTGADLRIDSTSGTISARRLVLAGGVGSRRLARDLAVSLPLVGAKGYHVEFADPDGSIVQPVFLAETRVVVTPLAGRLRLAGTLELGSDPVALGRRRVEAVAEAGTRHVAGLAGARITHVWRGLRPMTPDGMPIVGRAPADDRVILATGHGMLGITLAPVTGEHVATLARGLELHSDLAPLGPSRFRRLPRFATATGPGSRARGARDAPHDRRPR